MGKRCFLSTDCSGHWYIVDASKRKEWEEWTAIDEDDERAWDAPDYAIAVGGDPSNVEFIYEGKE